MCLCHELYSVVLFYCYRCGSSCSGYSGSGSSSGSRSSRVDCSTDFVFVRLFGTCMLSFNWALSFFLICLLLKSTV